MAEQEIRDAIAAMRKQYHDGFEKSSVAASKELSLKIEAKMAELSASITEGANKCAACDNAPHGMLKHTDPKYGTKIYEVGCLVCAPSFASKEEVTDGLKQKVTYRTSFASNGSTPAEATANWNAKKFRTNVHSREDIAK